MKSVDLPDPPAILSLAGNRLRWKLLRALVDGDRLVRELTALVGEPQNLVSYHLRILRDAELVTAHRSAADGRDTYYQLDPRRYGELLGDAGNRLHPALRLNPVEPSAEPVSLPHTRILFLCTGNSARSPMAEAILRSRTRTTGLIASAGSHPKPVHPTAMRVMARRGFDLTGHVSTHLARFAQTRLTCVITLCDKIRKCEPGFAGTPRKLHWSVSDPSQRGTDGAFAACADELDERIRYLLPTLADAAE